MAVDPAGNVHFVGVRGQRLIYWTNSSGAWENETIGSPPEGDLADKSPQIAINDSGDVVVAYERSVCFPLGCFGAVIQVTVRTQAGWSAPDEIATGVSPSLAAEDGIVGVAYLAIDGFTDVACEGPSPVDYAVSDGGAWMTTRVANDGYYPRLALGPDASPYVVFTDECGFNRDPGLYVAESDGDSFDLEPIPGTSGYDNVAHSMGVDGASNLHVLYLRYDDDDRSHFVHVVRNESGWTEPVEPLPNMSPRWMSVRNTGEAHLLGDGFDEGWWHAAGSPADFVADQITKDPADDFADGAIAVDSSGHAHVLFTTGGRRSAPFTLWYGVLTSQ